MIPSFEYIWSLKPKWVYFNLGDNASDGFMLTLRKNYDTFRRVIDFSSHLDQLPDDIIHFLYSRKCNSTINTPQHHDCVNGNCQNCGWAGFITYGEDFARSAFESDNEVMYSKQPNDLVRYSYYVKEKNDLNIPFILHTKLIPFSEFLSLFENALQVGVKKVVHTANQKKTATLCTAPDKDIRILGNETVMMRRDYSMKPKFKQDSYETTDNYRGGRAFSIENIIAYWNQSETEDTSIFI